MYFLKGDAFVAAKESPEAGNLWESAVGPMLIRNDR